MSLMFPVLIDFKFFGFVISKCQVAEFCTAVIKKERTLDIECCSSVIRENILKRSLEPVTISDTS